MVSMGVVCVYECVCVAVCVRLWDGVWMMLWCGVVVLVEMCVLFLCCMGLVRVCLLCACLGGG